MLIFAVDPMKAYRPGLKEDIFSRSSELSRVAEGRNRKKVYFLYVITY